MQLKLVFYFNFLTGLDITLKIKLADVFSIRVDFKVVKLDVEESRRHDIGQSTSRWKVYISLHCTYYAIFMKNHKNYIIIYISSFHSFLLQKYS